MMSIHFSFYFIHWSFACSRGPMGKQKPDSIVYEDASSRKSNGPCYISSSLSGCILKRQGLRGTTNGGKKRRSDAADIDASNAYRFRHQSTMLTTRLQLNSLPPSNLCNLFSHRVMQMRMRSQGCRPAPARKVAPVPPRSSVQRLADGDGW